MSTKCLQRINYAEGVEIKEPFYSVIWKVNWYSHYGEQYQFSCSVVSNSLLPHRLQHARLPCPSPTPGVCSTSCPSSRWCDPIISSCHALLLLSSIFSSIRVFSNESVLCIKWPKYWSFSFSISSSNEYSGLISFRMDCLDLLAVQGTLKSLLHATVQKHQFFCTQLSL